MRADRATTPDGDGEGRASAADVGATAAPDQRDGATPGASVTPGTAGSPLPFTDLRAPTPIPAAPPPTARWLAFSSILLGGLFAGMIGYGTADLLAGDGLWAPVGGLLGALTGAVGVGIVATLTLRAMNEWHAVNHPESASTPAIRSDEGDDDGADR